MESCTSSEIIWCAELGLSPPISDESDEYEFSRMTAFGYSVPKQTTERTLIYEVERTGCPIDEVAELLVEEKKADLGRLRRAREDG